MNVENERTRRRNCYHNASSNQNQSEPRQGIHHIYKLPLPIAAVFLPLTLETINRAMIKGTGFLNDLIIKQLGKKSLTHADSTVNIHGHERLSVGIVCGRFTCKHHRLDSVSQPPFQSMMQAQHSGDYRVVLSRQKFLHL